MATESLTSLTLLAQLRQEPANQAAWYAFVDRYGKRIYSWCSGWGLQDADAQDVTQNVLMKLALKMSTFQYDPAASFRSWLRTLAHHAWADYCESKQRIGAQGQLAELLSKVEARTDLMKRLEEEFDHELLERAIECVRQRVAHRTWEAFRLTALEHLSGAEAAHRLDMKVARVFVAKSEVRKLIQEEIQRLEG